MFTRLPRAVIFTFLLLFTAMAAPAQSLYNVNSGTATITEVDLYTGAVLGSIPTPVPTWVPAAGGPEGLAFDGTTLYFSSGNASLAGEPIATNRTLYWLDPATGTVLDQYELPAVAGGEREQAIDALAYGDYGGTPTLFANRPATNEIYLIEIATKTIYNTLSTATYSGIGGMGFSAYRQTIFISDTATDTVHEIDPATGTDLNSFSIAPESGILGVDFVENKLFLAFQSARAIIEVSPNTGLELNRYAAPTVYPSALAGDPGTYTGLDCTVDYLYVVNGNSSTYSILDPNTGIAQATFLTPVPTYPPGGVGYGGPEGLAFDGNELFYISGDAPVLTIAETIYQVDPCTGSVTGTLTPAFPAIAGDPTIDALAYGDYAGTPTLFAHRPDGNTVFHIDPTTGTITGSTAIAANTIGGIGYDNTTQTLWVSDFGVVPSMMYEVDPGTGAVLSSFVGPAGELQGVDFVGTRLFGAHNDGTGTIYEFDATGTLLNSFAAPDLFPSALAGPPSGSSGTVSITITPAMSPILIPAAGGVYQYTVQVANTMTTAQTVNVWMTISDGSGLSIVRGPGVITVPAGGTISGTVNQNVPSFASPGAYVQEAAIGTYPVAADTDSFPWEKSVTKGGTAQAVTNWDSTDPALWFAEGEATADVPADFALLQNYPNPFNPTTMIAFALPEALHIRVAVYDLTGREVDRLVDGFREAGRHEVRFDASALAAGVYLYRIEAGAFQATQRMVLLK